ncbi:MAG TPA: lipid II flippase MurJ, partial [Gemmatimonadaceae bacterium]|nr:lipid II flippase MurJ [Gemmatimonadaceae bacterium]
EAEAARRLRERTEAALRRIAFFVVPSAVAFVAVGDQIVGLIYGTGRFGAEEVRWVWGVLAGAAVGLVASTAARLYASAFYALRDSRTPFRFALVRVAVSTSLGALLALGAPRVLPIDPRWSVAGISIAAGLAGWVEFVLLRRALARRLGPVGLASRMRWTLWGAAGTAAAAAWAARILNAPTPALLRAALVLAVFGMVYWVFTWKAGVPEAQELRRTIFRRGR